MKIISQRVSIVLNSIKDKIEEFWKPRAELAAPEDGGNRAVRHRDARAPRAPSARPRSRAPGRRARSNSQRRIRSADAPM
eukprot:3680041-Pyramimonas_sp.AAC.1